MTTFLRRLFARLFPHRHALRTHEEWEKTMEQPRADEDMESRDIPKSIWIDPETYGKEYRMVERGLLAAAPRVEYVRADAHAARVEELETALEAIDRIGLVWSDSFESQIDAARRIARAALQPKQTEGDE